MKVLALFLMIVAACQARSIQSGTEEDLILLFKFVRELASTAAPATIKTTVPATETTTTVRMTTDVPTTETTTAEEITTVPASTTECDTKPDTTITTTTAAPTTVPTSTTPKPTTTTPRPTRPRQTTPDRVTGPTCIRSCIGLADGNYQDCSRCDVFISCVGETTIPNRSCPPGLVWDDRLGACWTSSTTCTPV